ncbi:MAG: hypothetical protein HY799_11155 [Nitrosomonadales bacterium]|nr:hypothetical protein [Nitrosomonadales bacterium]
MRINTNLLFVALATLLLSACSTTAKISSLQNEPLIHIKNDSTSKKVKDGTLDQKVASAAPRSESFPVSTFGKYEFKAVLPGREPFYGMLPRKFNGGMLALDILFFTPAMLLNLNGVYPFYEFDIENKTLRYKVKETDKWSTYQPSLADINRSKDFFGDSSPAAPTTPAQAAPTSSSAAQKQETPNGVM